VDGPSPSCDRRVTRNFGVGLAQRHVVPSEPRVQETRLTNPARQPSDQTAHFPTSPNPQLIRAEIVSMFLRGFGLEGKFIILIRIIRKTWSPGSRFWLLGRSKQPVYLPLISSREGQGSWDGRRIGIWRFVVDRSFKGLRFCVATRRLEGKNRCTPEFGWVQGERC